MKKLIIFIAVVVFAQAPTPTQIPPSLIAQKVLGMVNGVGSLVTVNGDGTGEVDVRRMVRNLNAAGSILPTDCHGMIVFTNTPYTFDVSTPNAVPGQFDNGCEVVLRNNGPGILTLTNGYTVAANGFCVIDSDGIVWAKGAC